MEFNRRDFEAFREDTKNALREVEKKYGLTMELGNIGYSDMEFKFSVTALKIGEQDIDSDQARFNYDCKAFGLKPEDYKAIVVINGKTFELIGFNPNGRKNVCKIRSIYDRENIYVCSLDSFKTHRLNS